MHSTITKKGQIVIPSAIRKKMGITPGTKIHIEEEGNTIVLKPITKEYISDLKGLLKPEKGEKSALNLLMEERKADRTRENGSL
ncbi:MAG: AbrB/MazE/SpoVT family DNA-binding domain-containing protein [Bacteroidota bacterium]